MVSLESKLAFLRQPDSFPEPGVRVETIETHMSWVFLTDRHAYKLKKPVRYGLLDFSTVEARRFYCEEEVRLNRRLAPDVYLATVALAVNAQGHLKLSTQGGVVDWLVKMRRLPAERMLDAMIKAGAAHAAHMQEIAALLVRFYGHCAAADIGPDEYRHRFARDIAQNRAVLCDPCYGLPLPRVERICSAQLAWLANRGALLDARVAAGRIVEGHGDLRAEHVCLEGAPVIIDCLEFSRDLRLTDTTDELAFLALECERLGAVGLGEVLLSAYRELSGEAPDPGLIHFYQSVRACLRARITITHLNEEQFRHSSKWQLRALAYLDLAERHAQAGDVTPAATR